MNIYKLVTLIVVSLLIAILLASALNSFIRVSDSALADTAPTVGTFSQTSLQNAPRAAPGKNYLPIIFLNSATAGGAWLLGGNAGTNPASDFLGTTDNMTLTVRVNNIVGWRLAPTGSNTPNVLGGFSGNAITSGVYGAMIGGGGGASGNNNSIGTGGNYATVSGGIGNLASSYASTLGGGDHNVSDWIETTVGGGGYNTASGSYAAVAGGYLNTAINQASTIGGGSGNNTSGITATIAGGQLNLVQSSAATIGGGYSNAITTTGDYAFIGGGHFNAAGGESAAIDGGWGNTASGYIATIGGGWINTAKGSYATVSGGQNNTASGNLYSAVGGGSNNTASGGASTVSGGQYNTASNGDASIGGGNNNVASGAGSTIPGGDSNLAQGAFSFAAGHNAHAQYDGSFVWNDSDTTGTPFLDSQANQFNVRATGGVRFYTSDTYGSYCNIAAGGGMWSCSSDKNVKANFANVDSRDILARVANLPITTWNYKSQDANIRHIGPMAQDFDTAFHVGEDDKTIGMLDEGGVALAAIQGLYQENQELQARVATLEQGSAPISSQNAKDRIKLTELENTVNMLQTQMWLIGIGLLSVGFVLGRRGRAR